MSNTILASNERLADAKILKIGKNDIEATEEERKTIYIGSNLKGLERFSILSLTQIFEKLFKP